MMHTVKVFGFGSLFLRNPDIAKDIDLLLLHRDVEQDSIRFTINCKRMIRTAVPLVHVVMLADAEEIELDFIRRSTAVHLANIESDFVAQQIAAFSHMLLSGMAPALCRPECAL